MGGEMRKTTDWQGGGRKRPLKVKGFRGSAVALVLPALVVLLVALLATCDIHSQFTDTIQKKVDEDLGDAVVTISYAKGDPGPAGGIIFYVDTADEHDWTYLEVAPATTEWTSKGY